MLERFDPLGRMMSLRQMMDRLMEDAFVVPRETSTATSAGTGTAALNAYEEGDNLVVETPLPGIKPEDIDVSIEAGTLTIRAQSRAEDERRERNYFVREYRSGSISRSIRLPETVDANAGQASFDNGVLRLSFPRTERARPRRIQVRGDAPPSGLPVRGAQPSLQQEATSATSGGGRGRRRASASTSQATTESGEQTGSSGRRTRRASTGQRRGRSSS